MEPPGPDHHPLGPRCRAWSTSLQNFKSPRGREGWHHRSSKRVWSCPPLAPSSQSVSVWGWEGRAEGAPFLVQQSPPSCREWGYTPPHSHQLMPIPGTLRASMACCREAQREELASQRMYSSSGQGWNQCPSPPCGSDHSRGPFLAPRPSLQPTLAPVVSKPEHSSAAFSPFPEQPGCPSGQSLPETSC